MSASFKRLFCCTFLLLVVVGLAGCGVTTQKSGAADLKGKPGIGYRFKVERRGEWRMSRQSSVYLAWPQADVGGDSSWPRTRTYLSRQLGDQARERFQKVTSGAVDDPAATVFERAIAANTDFVMQLLVHHVDTPSDFPDEPGIRAVSISDSQIRHKQLKMSLQVFEANSGRLLDTVNLSARRPWYLSELVPNSPLASDAINLMLDQLIH